MPRSGRSRGKDLIGTFVETPIAVSATESPIAKRGSKFSLGYGRGQAVRAGHKQSPQQVRNDAILPPTLSSDRTVLIDFWSATEGMNRLPGLVLSAISRQGQISSFIIDSIAQRY